MIISSNYSCTLKQMIIFEKPKKLYHKKTFQSSKYIHLKKVAGQQLPKFLSFCNIVNFLSRKHNCPIFLSHAQLFFLCFESQCAQAQSDLIIAGTRTVEMTCTSNLGMHVWRRARASGQHASRPIEQGHFQVLQQNYRSCGAKHMSKFDHNNSCFLRVFIIYTLKQIHTFCIYKKLHYQKLFIYYQ